MLFIIAMFIAVGFAVLLRKPLKKCSAAFYAAAVLISAAVSVFNFNDVPAFVKNYIIALFSRGALATGLWAVVMWMGALENGSKPKKALMPIRGELSILAALLTLGHNIGFGRIYFVRMFTAPSSMSGQQLAAGIISIIMLAIMLPLTVISFPKIRKKIKPKLWKQIQRAAYVFYALIYVHVMILSVPSAIAGRDGYLLTVAAYSVVFIGYAAFRIRNLIIAKNKKVNRKTLNAGTTGAMVLLCAAAIFVAFPKTRNEISSDIVKVPDKPDTSAESTQSTQPVVSLPASSVNDSTPVVTTVTESITESETPSENDSSSALTSAETIVDSDTPTENESTSAQPATESVTESETPSDTESSSTLPPVESIPEELSVYLDGEYTATAFGYDGDITVTVTIKDDKITDIKADSDESDLWYFDTAADKIISQILSEQNAGVDAVAGAAYSSEGIMAVVEKALEAAKRM